jgi:hypothetical protein
MLDLNVYGELIVINIQVGGSNESLFHIFNMIFLVYYNQLPMNVQQIPDFIKHREEFIKFNREFEPIR